MSYEWDESSPVVLESNSSFQSVSFQNSSFQRRGTNGPFRGRPNRFDGGGDRRGGGRGRFNRRDGNSYNNAGRNGNTKMIKVPSKFVGRVIGKFSQFL